MYDFDVLPVKFDELEVMEGLEEMLEEGEEEFEKGEQNEEIIIVRKQLANVKNASNAQEQTQMTKFACNLFPYSTFHFFNNAAGFHGCM